MGESASFKSSITPPRGIVQFQAQREGGLFRGGGGGGLHTNWYFIEHGVRAMLRYFREFCYTQTGIL